ncbi:MAG: hypothetical protein PHI97_29920 [Desulfobulbus sp.]|nr:hypothetical protein [Desulfobulbus sp.]
MFLALNAALAVSVTDAFNRGGNKVANDYTTYIDNVVYASKAVYNVANTVKTASIHSANPYNVAAYGVTSATANAASIAAYGVTGATEYEDIVAAHREGKYDKRNHRSGYAPVLDFAKARAAKAVAKTAAKAATNSKVIAAANGAASVAANDAAIANDLAVIDSGDYRNWPDLWHGEAPSGWEGKARDMLAGLRNRNLVYWAEEWENWIGGRFNPKKIMRALSMPRSTVEAGSKAMLVYLQAERLVRSAEARVVFLGEGEAGKTSLIRALFGEKIRGDEQATPRVEIRQRTARNGGQILNIESLWSIFSSWPDHSA